MITEQQKYRKFERIRTTDYAITKRRVLGMKVNTKELKWIREPKNYIINENKVEIVTEPNTDLWQRTYYHFRNDNALVLQLTTSDKYFSFVVKTEFESNVLGLRYLLRRGKCRGQPEASCNLRHGDDRLRLRRRRDNRAA